MKQPRPRLDRGWFDYLVMCSEKEYDLSRYSKFTQKNEISFFMLEIDKCIEFFFALEKFSKSKNSFDLDDRFVLYCSKVWINSLFGSDEIMPRCYY